MEKNFKMRKEKGSGEKIPILRYGGGGGGRATKVFKK